MIKRNKQFNYIPRYGKKDDTYFKYKNKKYKSNFFLIIVLIMLFLLTYFIINYQV